MKLARIWLLAFFSLVMPLSAVFAQSFAISDVQAEDVFSQALNYYSEGDTDRAIQMLRYLLSNGYTDQYIYYSILDMYTQKVTRLQMTGKTTDKSYFEVASEGKKIASEAVQRYPGNKKLLYQYSSFARNLNDTQEFTRALQEILKLDDEDLFANYWMGAYLFLNKEYDKATVYFQKVVSVPQSGNDEFSLMALYRSYYNLGMIMNNSGNYRLGVQYLEKARTIYGRDYELIRYLAFTYAEMLETDKAIRYFSQIPEIYRSEEVAGAFAGVLFLKNDPRLNELIMEYKDESSFINAIRYYKEGDYTNSLKQLDLHIARNNFADFYSHYLLFQDYRALGDTEKAAQQAFLVGNRAKEVGKFDIAVRFYKAVEENTNSIPEIYWLIGSLYDDSDKAKEAIRYYEKYLGHERSGKFRIPALVRLSYLYYKTGEKKKARKDIETAKKTAANNDDIYQVYYYSGLMNIETRSFADAIRDLKKAATAMKKDARLYYFMATAQFESGLRKDAIRSLESAREIEKNSPEINNLLAYLYSLEKTNLDDALVLVNQAIIASPENIAYLDTRGWIYFQKNDFRNSFEVLRDVQELIEKKKYDNEEGFDEIYYHLGMIYEKVGKPAEARKFYQTGYKINPKNGLLKKKVK